MYGNPCERTHSGLHYFRVVAIHRLAIADKRFDTKPIAEADKRT